MVRNTPFNPRHDCLSIPSFFVALCNKTQAATAVGRWLLNAEETDKLSDTRRLLIREILYMVPLMRTSKK